MKMIIVMVSLILLSACQAPVIINDSRGVCDYAKKPANNTAPEIKKYIVRQSQKISDCRAVLGYKD